MSEGRIRGRRSFVAVLAIFAMLAVSIALAPGAGAEHGEPHPDFGGKGSLGDGPPTLRADAEANRGPDGSPAGHVSLAPGPYADCTFYVEPLIELIQTYFEEVFDEDLVQNIRDHAGQDPEDGTTTGDGPESDGLLSGLLGLIHELLDRLQATAHLLGLAKGDLDSLFKPFVLVTCPPGAIRQDVFVWPQGESVPETLVAAYAAQAYEEIPFPLLGIHSAPAGTADEPLVVNVETWLWSNDQYGPAQARAGITHAVYGTIVEVTATATPTVTEWDPGNGQDPVYCDGQGTPWSPSLGDGANPDCSLRYLSSSSMSLTTGTFTLTRSTHWDVEWVCEPDCGSDVLDPVIVVETREVSVAEIQAVVTDD